MHEDHRLVPKRVRYTNFVSLIKSFETVDDGMVSPRYHYGELRLTRLNFWSKILLFRFTYYKVEGQYGAYFARFYGPILFLFALLSVLLSAMQVVLAVQDLVESVASWEAFAKVSRGFSVFALVIVAIMVLFLLLALVTISSREALYALKDLYRKRPSRGRTNGAAKAFQMATEEAVASQAHIAIISGDGCACSVYGGGRTVDKDQNIGWLM